MIGLLWKKKKVKKNEWKNVHQIDSDWYCHMWDTFFSTQHMFIGSIGHLFRLRNCFFAARWSNRMIWGLGVCDA